MKTDAMPASDAMKPPMTGAITGVKPIAAVRMAKVFSASSGGK